jgi:isopentenyl-diphosphate delta-isomerase type 1
MNNDDVGDSEMIVLVDANDRQIGLAEKMQAHQQGLLHRAFSVFIIRATNNGYEILMHQRNSTKYHCGGLWTNTCCSHPRDQENIVQAAQRRLQEEMGLQIDLQEIGAFTYKAVFSNGLVEHEYDHVMIGFYNDEEFVVNNAEVQDFQWMKLSAIDAALAKEPDKYTPWLEPALNIVRKHMEQK